MPKPPDYRLQVLLEMRERKKEECERLLGDALKAQKLEEDKQKEMELELERMVAKREQKKREYAEKAMRGEMSAQDVVSAGIYVDRLKELEEAQKNAIEGQKAVVEQKKKETAEARQNLTKATQELKALEKHKEKWIDDWKKELQAKEDETMDELAQQIYLNRDRS